MILTFCRSVSLYFADLAIFVLSAQIVETVHTYYISLAGTFIARCTLAWLIPCQLIVTPLSLKWLCMSTWTVQSPLTIKVGPGIRPLTTMYYCHWDCAVHEGKLLNLLNIFSPAGTILWDASCHLSVEKEREGLNPILFR